MILIYSKSVIKISSFLNHAFYLMMGHVLLEIGGFSGNPGSNEKWILDNLRPKNLFFF